jgi:hypothetical protein
LDFQEERIQKNVKKQLHEQSGILYFHQRQGIGVISQMSDSEEAAQKL